MNTVRIFTLRIFIFCIVVLSSGWSVLAQDTTEGGEAITPDNASCFAATTLLTPGSVGNMLWSPDGRLLVLATSTGIWLHDGNDITQPPRLLPGSPINARFAQLVFSPDSRSVAATAAAPQLWKLVDQDGNIAPERVPLAPIVEEHVRDARFLTNDQLVALRVLRPGPFSSEGDHSPELYDARTGERLARIGGDLTTNFLLATNGRYLLNATGTRLLIEYLVRTSVWSFETEAQLWQVEDVERAWFTPDSRQVAVQPQYTDIIRLYDVESGELHDTLEPNDFVFTLDARALLVNTAPPNDETVGTGLQVWRYEDSTYQAVTDEADAIAVLPIGFSGLTGAALHPDGVQIVTIDSNEGVLRLWNTQNVELLAETRGAGYEFARPFTTYNADGTRLLTAHGGTVRIWDVAEFDAPVLLATYLLETDPPAVVTAAAFHSLNPVTELGDVIALGDDSGAIHLVNWTTGERVWARRLNGQGRILALAFNPEGYWLRAVTNTHSVWTVRAATGNQVGSTILPNPGGSTYAFSPDSHLLARVVEVVGNDATGNGANGSDGAGERIVAGELWDISFSRAIPLLGNGDFDDAAFSADGTRLVTKQYQGVASVWNTATGEQVAQLGAATLDTEVALSPAGDVLVTPGGAFSSALAVYDVRTGVLRAEATAYNLTTDVSFSPDGRTIVSGGIGGSVWLWGIPPECSVSPFWLPVR